MVKILITRFELFGRDDNNLIRYITEDMNSKAINVVKFAELVLHTSYLRVRESSLNALCSVRSDVYVGTGLALGS